MRRSDQETMSWDDICDILTNRGCMGDLLRLSVGNMTLEIQGSVRDENMVLDSQLLRLPNLHLQIRGIDSPE